MNFIRPRINMSLMFQLTTVIVSLLGISSSVFATLAFPGAEGFGAKTRGAYTLYEKTGKNSDLPKILHVTNLNDRGTGSLRKALNENFPRIVVFDVGGVIMLEKPLDVSGKHNLTIAGQTAPGDGVILRGARLTFYSTHDVIIRGLKIRPADDKGDTNPIDRDGITLIGGYKDKSISTENIIIDHCSFAWTADKVISMWNNTGNITIQNSILAEPLRTVPGHKKKNHNVAILAGQGADHVSIIRNLISHSAYRNPVFGGSGPNITELPASSFGEIVNNVIYNGSGNSSFAVQRNRTYQGDQPQLIVSIGNYRKSGINTTGTFDYGIFPKGRSPDWDIENYVDDSSRFYIAGDINMHRYTQSLDDWDVFNPGSPKPKDSSRINVWPFPKSNVSYTKDAKSNYIKLLGMDGDIPRIGSYPRDYTDQRIINDVINGTGKWINSVKEVGGYPTFVPGTTPTDTDQDGMSDYWENRQGLDKNNPDDAHSDLDGDGYSNVEEYINSFLDAEFVDSDGDGVPDVNDAFPWNPTESVDSDGDGLGDNIDSNGSNGSAGPVVDSDGDGVPDVNDAFPWNPTESVDSDGDGLGDNSDSNGSNGSAGPVVDSDGDGVPDVNDAFPWNPTESVDSDGDGLGDNIDTDS